MPKKQWKVVYFSQLDKSSAKPDATISYQISDFTCERGITIKPLGRGAYTGDIIKGNRITGRWTILPDYETAIVTSYLRKSQDGCHKRYMGGHVACDKIYEAVMQWRDGFFHAAA